PGRERRFAKRGAPSQCACACDTTRLGVWLRALVMAVRHPHGERSAAAAPTADALVIFGITGDLARKMTFRSLYRLERRGLLGCPIVGVALEDWSIERLRDHARQAIQAGGEGVDRRVFERLAARLSYLSGDFSKATTFRRLKELLGRVRTPVFYLEIPPSLF